MPNGYIKTKNGQAIEIVDAKARKDLENNEDKQLAISNAKNIVVEIPKDDTYSIYEKFIEDNKLEDPMYVQDLVQLVEPNSTKYYTDFATAVSDVNAGNSSHATTSATGAVCKMAKNSDGIVVLCLLNNIAINAPVNISKPLFIDINGFRMVMGMNVIINTSFLCLYGMKKNSVIETQCMITQNKGTAYAIGFTVNVSNPYEQVILFGLRDTHKFTKIKKVNCTNTNNNVREFMFAVSGNAKAEGMLCLEDCDLYIENKPRYMNSLIQLTSDENFIYYIRNSNISFRSLSVVNGLAPYVISTVRNQTLIIENSILYGTNGIGLSGKTYIQGSLLKGVMHGGIYVHGGTCVFAKNSTFEKENDSNVTVSNNTYSCYIGYNASAYFDNCEFTSYNNQYNRPAIKTGNGDPEGAVYNNTQAHFSNCEMDSIRVDAGCRAYMGLGMSDELKNQTVNGEIIDYGDESYSFNLIIKDKNKESVSDVQINGTSILENGVANIPIGSPLVAGVVKPAGATYGISYQTSGNISTASATDSDIIARTNNYKPIVPANLEKAVTSVINIKPADESEEFIFVEEKDLENYVKNTDYATGDVAGVVKAHSGYGIQCTSSGTLQGFTRTQDYYTASNNGLIISKGTLENIKNSLVKSVADNEYISKNQLMDAGIKSIEWTINVEGTFSTVEDPLKSQRPEGTNLRYWVEMDRCPYFYHSKMYRVTFDGTVYDNLECRYGLLVDEDKGSVVGSDTDVGGCWQMIGNRALYDSRYVDTGEPFAILYVEHGGMHNGGSYYYSSTVGHGILLTKSAQTVNLKIETATITKTDLPHCLDEDFGGGDKLLEMTNSTYPRASWGQGNIVGRGSFAIGNSNISIGQFGVAIGSENKQTEGIALGHNNVVGSSGGKKGYVIGRNNISIEKDSIAIGVANRSEAINSVAIGCDNSSMKKNSYIFGLENTIKNQDDSTPQVSIGYNNIIDGVKGHAYEFGSSNTIRTTNGFAFGLANESINAGNGSQYMFGYLNESQGYNNSTFGFQNKIVGNMSIAIGAENVVNGSDSTCVGLGLITSRKGVVALGKYNKYDDGYTEQASEHVITIKASGSMTSYFPKGIIINSISKVTINGTVIPSNLYQLRNYYNNYGYYGIAIATSPYPSVGSFITVEYVGYSSNTTGKHLIEIGNGTSDTKRSNAHTLDWDGNAWYQGDIYVGGTSQDTDSKKVATEEYVDNKMQAVLDTDFEIMEKDPNKFYLVYTEVV